MLLRKMGYLIEALAPDMPAAVAVVVKDLEVTALVDVPVLVLDRVQDQALDAVLVDVRIDKKCLGSGSWHNCEVPLPRECQ
jgi:hypothetical protein